MSSLAAGASAVHHLLGRILPRRRHTSPIWTPTSRPAMWSRFLSSSSPGVAAAASLQPPDVPRLADTARIELSPEEAEEFAPKIGRVIDWFGQLQVVDLENIEPSLRADTSVRANPREDLPETFENRDAIVAAVPSFDDPFIKVPKVLNKE